MSTQKCVRLSVLHISAVTLGFLIYSSSIAFAEQESDDIHVMSFNIRYGTANDGNNHWDRRKEFLVETIQAFSPDLLGTQETLGFQADYLSEKLPEYGWLGVGRTDGGSDGEMTALFYRKSRFEKIDGGHFWLSDTPEKVGSVGWDSALPRMATWVRLRDRSCAAAKPILFMNTHFDHVGAAARLESAKLMREKIDHLKADGAVVVTGDFNAGEDSPPYQALFADVSGRSSPVIDSYRLVNPPPHPEKEGTFSGFLSNAITGPRIDWIGLSRDWTVNEASIDRTERDGRTPSDHFPVTAVIREAVPAK